LNLVTLPYAVHSLGPAKQKEKDQQDATNKRTLLPTTTFVKQQTKPFNTTNMSTSESKSATALFSALQNHNASSLALVKIEDVVEIDSKMKPIDAANVLYENNILGAPVWDEAAHKYCGNFDMRDFLSAVIAASVIKDTDEYNTAMVKEMHEKIKQDKKAMEVPCTVTYLASRNPVFSCGPETSLQEICKLLSAPLCRRVLICTEEKGARSTNMVTRTAIMKFLSQHVPRHDLRETLDEAGLSFRKEVVQVMDSVPARRAFELIDSKGIYALAVVDEEGTLLANTSARDIKLAAMDKGKAAMDLDILSYLAAVRQAAPAQGGNERYPASHVHEDSSVGHVLNLLVKTGYHQIFVVNEELRPIGVISQQDILRFIVEKSEKAKSEKVNS
jgi:CBS domain-containing protein